MVVEERENREKGLDTLRLRGIVGVSGWKEVQGKTFVDG